jgi:hypothetical protein
MKPGSRQLRAEGKFPVIGFVNRRRRALPREEGRERPCLHGQGRDRLVLDRLQPDQEAA